MAHNPGKNAKAAIAAAAAAVAAAANAAAAQPVPHGWGAGSDTAGKPIDKGTPVDESPPVNTGPAPEPPAPTPPVSPWSFAVTYTAPVGIKQAEPDIVIQGDEVESPELLTQLFFEEMGGVELISMSRSDMIDGIDVSYSPIANLSALRRRFNPNNIIASSSRESDYFKGFGIDIEARGAHVPYFDADGNLVIEIDIVGLTEIVELDIATSGTMNRITL